MTEDMWLAQVLKKTEELRKLLESSPIPISLFTWEGNMGFDLCARSPDACGPAIVLAELELGTEVFID